MAELTATLMDIESVSGNERALADAIEAALRRIPALEVHRDGDAIVARTMLGRARAGDPGRAPGHRPAAHHRRGHGAPSR